jgi:glycosyltransferase involved in cell wall biosynthesis
MRVLHIFSGNMYGGVERMLQTIAECKGYCPEMESRFAYCFEGRLSAELRRQGETLYHLGEARVRWLPGVWRVRKTLQRLLAEQTFDCVVCHGAWLQAIFGPAARAAKVPDIFWQHDVPDGKHWVQRWAKLAPPDYIFSDSRFLHDGLEKLYPGIPASPFYYAVLPPAQNHNRDDRQRLREELETPREAAVIIQVSRMEAWKGHTLLLEALTGMADVPGWVCWVAGGPQRPQEERYFESLKGMARDRGISDRVRFLGQRSDVPGLLNAADIFTQPNITPEPFGTVFVEALYAGLPVVTVNFGGGREVVDETCGVLVPPGDALALKDALASLVGSSELRAALAKGGPARARQLCDPATRLNALYHQLGEIASRSRPGPTRVERHTLSVNR